VIVVGAAVGAVEEITTSSRKYLPLELAVWRVIVVLAVPPERERVLGSNVLLIKAV
jgi:hypothetical protein